MNSLLPYDLPGWYLGLEPATSRWTTLLANHYTESSITAHLEITLDVFGASRSFRYYTASFISTQF